MKTHQARKQEQKSQSVSDLESQSKNGAAFQLVDNRCESVVQQKMHEMAKNGNQGNQTAQLKAMVDNHAAKQEQPIQKKQNKTGLPDDLKTGMENLTGHALDNVQVHRNSDQPAQLNAHAFAQGTDIHLGPGQEKHLPHELGHVVQQKEGRVQPTKEFMGEIAINDNEGLESEADSLGAKALNQTNEKSNQLKFKSVKEEAPFQLHGGGVNPKSKRMSEATAAGSFLDKHIKKKGDQTKLIGVKGGQGRAAELSGAADVQESLGLKPAKKGETNPRKGIKASLEKLDSKLYDFLNFDNAASASVLADADNGGLSDAAKWNVIMVNSDFMSFIQPGLTVNKIIPDNKVNNIVATGNMNASNKDDLTGAWDNAIGGSVADKTNYDDGLTGKQAIANFGLDYGGYEEIDKDGKAHALYKGQKVADLAITSPEKQDVDKGYSGLSPYVKEVARDKEGHAKLDTVSNVFYVQIKVDDSELKQAKVPLHGSIYKYAAELLSQTTSILASATADADQKAKATKKHAILTKFMEHAKVDDSMTVSSLSDGVTKNMEDPLTNLGITKPGSRLISQYGTINQEYHLSEVVKVKESSGLWLKDSTGVDTQVADCYMKEDKVLFRIIPAAAEKMNQALADNKAFHG